MQSFNSSWFSSSRSISLYDFNKSQEGKRNTIVVRNTGISTQREIKYNTDEDKFESRVLATFLSKEKLRDKNNVIPVPPTLLSSEQRQARKMVTKFRKKYQFLWVMLSQPDHQGRKAFFEIYKDDSNGNSVENLLTGKQAHKIKLFLASGLDIKLVSDYENYQNYLKSERKMLNDDPKLLEVEIEQGKMGQRAQPLKKIKSIPSLTEFLVEEVVEEMEKARKDIPYYNFIHMSSSPELFNRRSILQNCLFSKSQEEYLENHKRFVNMIKDDTQNSFNYRMNEIIRDGGIQRENNKKREIDKREKKKYINEEFQRKFQKYVEDCYPIEEQSNKKKEQIANWIITQYCVESSIYVVLNNTIRFSLNQEKIKPVSAMIRYLYDALHYYFIEKHYRYKFLEGQVYRGSRISIGQQRQFQQGQYLWNLGFTSTSRKQPMADKFLKMIQNEEQRVKVVIQFSKFTSNVDYLWDQEGFCCIDQISEINEAILVDEEEVLFNPLNTFEILKWNPKTRILLLLYSPQLDILEKKKNRQQLTPNEEQLLLNLSKLKNRTYDRGQELLEEGDPAQAIKYYEISQEQGEQLTIQQKQTYINSLVEVGDIHKVDTMIKEFYAQEGVYDDEELDFGSEEKIENEQEMRRQPVDQVEKQIQQDILMEKNIQKVNKALQITKIFQTTEDFEAANKKAETTAKMATKLAVKVPDRSTLLIQVRSHVQLSTIKFKVNDTLSSIKECIRSLKIIDQLAGVNLCFNLYDLGKEVKNLKRIPQDLQSLSNIGKQNNFLTLNLEQYKQETLKKVEDAINEDITDVRKSANIKSSSQKKEEFERANEIQQDYIVAEQMLQIYFDKRKQRSDVQDFQQLFIQAFYEVKNYKISKLRYEEDKERMKELKQKLLLLKNEYKEIFEAELEVYEVLYQNLYKTNIDLKYCLESYKNNLFKRYQNFMKKERDAYGDSVEYAKFLRKHGKFLCQYGQLIEKKKGSRITRSEKAGIDKIEKAKKILEEELVSETEDKKFFTFEKTQINNTLSTYYKNNSIFRKEEDKEIEIDPLVEVQLVESQVMFQNLMDCVQDNKKLHKEDKNINKAFYVVKDVSFQLQIVNSSSNIQLDSSTYESRLTKCSDSYNEAIELLSKQKKDQEFMQKNTNLARLHLLMGENQARLGIIMKSMQYLRKANKTLYIALKIDPENPHLSVFNKKLLYGNKIKLQSLKLQSKLIAFYGKQQEQKEHIDYLGKIKNFVYEQMNEPLAQADLSESIGLLLTKCCIVYKQPPQMAFETLQTSIAVRKKILGPNNKFNARIYTILIQLAKIKNEIKKKEQYYQSGREVYGKIDINSDPLIKIYGMLLQTNYLISRNKEEDACRIYDEGLTFYDNHKNKLVIFQVAKEMHSASKILFQEQSYQKKGYYWMDRAMQYLKELERGIHVNYAEQIQKKKFVYKKFSVIGAMLRLYNDLINSSDELGEKKKKKEYEKELEEIKERYQVKKNIQVSQVNPDPVGRMFEKFMS